MRAAAAQPNLQDPRRPTAEYQRIRNAFVPPGTELLTVDFTVAERVYVTSYPTEPTELHQDAVKGGPGAVLIWDGVPDTVRLPTDLRHIDARLVGERAVVTVGVFDCACGTNHLVRRYTLAVEGLMVYECTRRGFLWALPRSSR